MFQRYFALIIILGYFISFYSLPALAAPKLQLANTYQSIENIDDFWVSEKLDGVRAYWNGTQLLTRKGNLIAAPNWFTKNFPDTPLDGELWIARGQFERLLSTVGKHEPDDQQWSEVNYMIFDLPAETTSFDKRLIKLQVLINQLNIQHLQPVIQFKVASLNELMQRLTEITSQGAEGLMLHRGSSLYQGHRSDDLQKLKLYADAEARVIAHLPGKGKYRNMLGALLVEMPNGIRFKIGTGFSNLQRQNPPSIGSMVTYKHYGLTINGIPKFASFMRIRSAAF